MQTHFFVVRRISCTNAVHIHYTVVSWSRNFVFKVDGWCFLTHRWVGGREKICVSMTLDRAPHWRCLSWWVLKPVSHISGSFEFCHGTFTVVVSYFFKRGDYRVLLQLNWLSAIPYSAELVTYILTNFWYKNKIWKIELIWNKRGLPSSFLSSLILPSFIHLSLLHLQYT